MLEGILSNRWNLFVVYCGVLTYDKSYIHVIMLFSNHLLWSDVFTYKEPVRNNPGNNWYYFDIKMTANLSNETYK